MSDKKSTGSTTLDDGREAALREYLAAALMAHVTRNGTVGKVDAYNQVAAVADRSLSTVKNWLVSRTLLPDLASLLRIALHWSIPLTDLLPQDLGSRLSLEETQSPPGLRLPPGHHVKALSLGSWNDPFVVAQELSAYTDDPGAIVFIRQDSADMAEEICKGELLMVDTKCDRFDGDGIYLLLLNASAGPTKMCTRRVTLVRDSPGTVHITTSRAKPRTSETARLKGGLLHPKATVLGRVVGVMKKL